MREMTGSPMPPIRDLLAACLGAILMAGVGAFETGEAAPWTLYSYWLLLMLLGVMFGRVAIERCELSVRDLIERPAVFARGVAVVAAVMTPAIFVMAWLAMGGEWSIDRLPILFGQALLVCSIQMLLQCALDPDRSAQPEMDHSATRDLRSRLPLHLRDARVVAVQGEDHYTRVHTVNGSALLLMRLGDALAELGGADGMRTHRSWWVARDAVVAARRGGGRAVLRLATDIEAPVSRTYAPQLRRAGWY